MISNLLIRLTRFFTEKKVVFFLILFILGTFLADGVRRLRISENIYDTLPKASDFGTFQRLISESGIDGRVLFSMDVPQGGDINALSDTVAVLGEKLRQVSANYLVDVREFREDVNGEVMSFVLENLPILLDSTLYPEIDRRIQPEAIRSAVASSRQKLSTPEGTWTKELLLGDPLGLSYPFFKNLREATGAVDSRIENDMLLINNGAQVLITARTNFPSGDTEPGTTLYQALEKFREEWNNNHPEYRLQYFAGFAIAANNAIQIKRDALMTISLALIVILGLLWAYYRSLKLSAIILLPALFGGLSAVGLIGHFNPDVSGISLATGAVLLGIALDYSIHFVSHFRHTGSVSATLKDISTPLMTGSLTTILAYSALIFANSRLLSDFGLFAGLALSSALMFTLIGLPVILHLTHSGGNGHESLKPLFSVPSIPRKLNLPVIGVFILVTVLFYRLSDRVSFDGDPRNLSVETEAMMTAERTLTPLDPENDVQLYLFSTGDSAGETNQNIYQRLLNLKSDGLVKSFNSVAPFSVSDRVKTSRSETWNRYWQNGEKATTVKKELQGAGEQQGFAAGAFSHFEGLIDGYSHKQSGDYEEDILAGLGLNQLIYQEGDNPSYITTVIVSKAHLEEVKASLREIEGANLFYRAEMAEALLETVQEDFNYILFVSAGIVFVALLLFYGRLELALLSFLPMVISWIWIIGLTVLAGVKFNFVNVVFATFIFGLGDDFSIFMTDGLLQRYRQGKNKLSSYTSAISLSGLTVIIGTGVLLFAQHPALKSIAVVSVPGILCIVFVSLTLQPVLFDLFVQGRVDKGRTPISILTFTKTWFCFAFFVCMCYLAFVVMVFLIILPVSRKKKKEWLAWVMSKLSTAVMYSGTQIRKRIYGKELLDYTKPAILIANHSSFLDTMIMLMLHPKAVIMVKEWVYKSPLYGWVIRYANYLFMEEGTDANLRQAKELVDDGYSIIIFPEGTRSEDGKVRRFHKGAFYLAEQLNLPVQPVFIHGAGYVSPKNELVIKHGPVNISIQPRIEPDDLSWGENFQQRTKSISRHFKAGFNAFTKQMDDTRFMKQRIFNNYIFKGPVLEYYFKVKWELEKKNYEYYDRLIENRKNILDLGCGYGFLSFYLHYRDEERNILGVDYDEEKVEIAANSYGKTDKLHFIQGDITSVAFGQQDVIFLNDVLHYLSEEEQRAVLQRCVNQLNAGGILFIRDGVTDESEAHKNTKMTEWFSTKIFSFNKKERPFHFFSKTDIRQMADCYGLSLEEISHSKKTSNMLFILRKEANTKPEI